VAPKNITVSHEDEIFGYGNNEDEDFTLPGNIEPFLADEELYTSETASAIALWWAPYPFDRRSGKMVRAQDVPWSAVVLGALSAGSTSQGPGIISEAAQDICPERTAQEEAEGAE
jgi:hypothetical protein